jgi:effector-binding domain-containing protein
MVFRIGYAFSGPAPETDPRVQIGETPEGKVLKVAHRGARGDLPATYAKLRAYLDAYRLKPRSGPWELFRETTSTAAPLIEIYVPVR